VRVGDMMRGEERYFGIGIGIEIDRIVQMR
jgi:hypothetical protein